MKKNRVLALVLAVPVLVLAVLYGAGSAQATDPTTETSNVVALTIKDRDDSGTHGVLVWAKDTLNRKVTVTTDQKPYVDRVAVSEAVPADCATLDGLLWKYTVKVEDEGTFVTVAGQSPEESAPLAAGVTGTVKGSAEGTVVAPAYWCSWTGDEWNGEKQGSETGSTGEFVAKLFSGNEFQAKVDLSKWGWTYERCGEKWVNASDGNSGDITGKTCPPPTTGVGEPASTAPPAGNAGGGELVVTGVNGKTIGLAGVGALLAGALALWWGKRKREQEPATE